MQPTVLGLRLIFEIFFVRYKKIRWRGYSRCSLSGLGISFFPLSFFIEKLNDANIMQMVQQFVSKIDLKYTYIYIFVYNRIIYKLIFRIFFLHKIINKALLNCIITMKGRDVEYLIFNNSKYWKDWKKENLATSG